MKNGLYRVQFETAQQISGAGVVFILNGQIFGGDSAFAFTGNLAENGGVVMAQVISKRHTANPFMPSVFGIDNVNIALRGKATGDRIELNGSADQAPGIGLRAVLDLIAA